MNEHTEHHPTPAHVRTREIADAAISRYLRATEAGKDWQDAVDAASDGTALSARAAGLFSSFASDGMTTRQARAETVALMVAETALDQFQHLCDTGVGVGDAIETASGDSPVARDAVSGFLTHLTSGRPLDLARDAAENDAVVVATREEFADIELDELESAIDLVAADLRERGHDVDLTDGDTVEQVRASLTHDEVDSRVTDPATLAAYRAVLDAHPVDLDDALQGKAERDDSNEPAPEPSEAVDTTAATQAPAKRVVDEGSQLASDCEIPTADSGAPAHGEEDTAAPGQDATGAALERIDAVLSEPGLSPWEAQVERCEQSVQAAAKAVTQVEGADRAEWSATWHAEEQATADAFGHERGLA